MASKSNYKSGEKIANSFILMKGRSSESLNLYWHDWTSAKFLTLEVAIWMVQI